MVLGVPTNASWLMIALGLIVSVALFATALPGELFQFNLPEESLMTVNAVVAVVSALLCFNAFLKSGSRRVLWIGIGLLGFAVGALFFITSSEHSLRYYFVFFSAAAALLATVYAYTREDLVPQPRRTGRLLADAGGYAVAVAAVCFLAVCCSSYLPSFVENDVPTPLFRLLAVYTAIWLILTSLLYLQAYIKTRSPVSLAIAGAYVFFTGSANAFGISLIYLDEWWWLGMILQFAGFLIVLVGFLYPYFESWRR